LADHRLPVPQTSFAIVAWVVQAELQTHDAIVVVPSLDKMTCYRRSNVAKIGRWSEWVGQVRPESAPLTLAPLRTLKE